MQERAKVALMQRIIDAWYRGDLDAVLAECTPDFEFDLTGSDIPGLSDVYRGRDGYLSSQRLGERPWGRPAWS
jgi:ketosteroid isomerase-like protein